MHLFSSPDNIVVGFLNTSHEASENDGSVTISFGLLTRAPQSQGEIATLSLSLAGANASGEFLFFDYLLYS